MKNWMLLIGPLLAAAVGYACVASGLTEMSAWAAAITCLCALWWITEPIPIPVTSLIPLAVFPMVGVLSATKVGEAYGNPLILLFLGGFMLSAAMERSGAHRRIAVRMVRMFGSSSGRRLVFGFMTASAMLSMWISNVATTLMLLPIVLAVVEKTDNRRLSLALLLGIAYGASIGGIGTPIGTPPNLVFMQVYTGVTGQEVTFLDWMSWALPIALVMAPVAAFWLTRGMGKQSPIELPEVGAWRAEELRTLGVFAVTAVLWVTRKEPFGGWSTWANIPSTNDASVALLAVVALFIIPNGKGEKLMDWETAAKIPWGILILYGGGIAIATAFTSSGLSDTVGRSLEPLTALPMFLMIALICLAVTFLTEITSNTATATLLMPILAAAAVSADIDPKLIMVPATISTSFAFMLPVATPPNAVVFGSERVTVGEMAREGIVLNLIGVVVVSVLSWWLL